jgi:hypothetical protein
MSTLTLSGSLRYVALAALVAGGALVMRGGGSWQAPIERLQAQPGYVPEPPYPVQVRKTDRRGVG